MANEFDEIVTTVLNFTALTASGVTATQTLPQYAQGNLVIGIRCNPVSGTTPSATFSVEWSHDGSTFFVADGGPENINTTAITATQATGVIKTFPIKGMFFHIKYTITGTTPSFTTIATWMVFPT